jgi:hypothetical protein
MGAIGLRRPYFRVHGSEEQERFWHNNDTITRRDVDISCFEMRTLSIPNIGILLLTVFGKPRHNGTIQSDKVNDFDLQGNACPRLTKTMLCPAYCVRSLNDCPATIRPERCQSGQFYCADGVCHDGASPEFACAKVKSICSCKEESESRFVPCKTQHSIVADGRLSKADREFHSLCGKSFNQSLEAQSFFATCSMTPQIPFSVYNKEFVFMYALLAVEGSILLLFINYKRVQRVFKI